MNAFQRAWAYVTRRPAKSILLIITFFLIGNLVILGLGISQAAENAKVLTRKSMRAVVSYEADYDAFWEYTDSLTSEDERMEAYNHSPRVSKEMALELAEDPRVSALNYMVNMQGFAIGFNSVPVGNENERNSGGLMIGDDGTEYAYVDPDLMIYANMFPEFLEMKEGTFTIEEGRFYSQSDLDESKKVVVITKELAETNNFHVGDTIKLSMAQPAEVQMIIAQLGDTTLTEDDLKIDYEIIGIYNNANEVDPNADNFQWMSAWESPKNIVLMPYTTYRDSMAILYKYYYAQYGQDTGMSEEEYIDQMVTPSNVVYLLDDPLDVDGFVADHQNDLGEFTKLNANNEQFKKVARPLDTMSFFANIVVWIVVVNAVVIISLVTALTLKTREYEIGVMLSLGVSKFKVVLQLFTELIVLALLGFTLAVGSGSLIAGKVGSAVLEYQTASEAQYEDTDTTYYWTSGDSYFTEVTQEEMLAQYHVSVSPMLIGEIYLLGAGVVLIAIVIPSFMIMRLNPKQILLEQN